MVPMLKKSRIEFIKEKKIIKKNFFFLRLIKNKNHFKKVIHIFFKSILKYFIYHSTKFLTPIL